jgi:hypothetical protein
MLITVGIVVFLLNFACALWWINRHAAPATEPKVFPDDWTPTHGPWYSRFRCHCGFMPKNTFSWGYAVKSFPDPTEQTVCPECGHRGKFTPTVGRWESEVSQSRKDSLKGSELFKLHTLWERNNRFRPWTPEDCQAKAED